MVVSVQRGMDEDAVAKREEEEQRFIEATIRSRAAQRNCEAPGPRLESSETGSLCDGGGGAFGSSLDNYNRSRTFSNSSSNVSGSSDRGGTPTPGTPIRDDSSALLCLAMSPEDRRELEREMRAQQSHPVHQRMENEAEEARMRHVQEWYSSESGIRSRLRDARMTELTRLLEAISAPANDDEGGNQSARGGEREGGRGRGSAYNLGSLIRAMEASSGVNGRNSNNRGRGLEDLMRLEAAFLFGLDDDMTRQRTLSNRGTSGGNSSDNEDGDGRQDNYDNSDGIPVVGLSAHRRRPSSSLIGLETERSARLPLGLVNRGVSSTHLDTAELLMQGISEDEQLAMAIALSMQAQLSEQTQQTEEAGQSDNRNSQSSHNSHDSGRNSEEGSSSESSLESSSESSIEVIDRINTTSEGTNNDNCALSLDEDEEEVVFVDDSFAG